MYINKVVGTAFGPLRSETLDLAPGLNVVHGPNEAGKSSWFNAIYAGLAGRRKFKGKGSAAEADFKNRHKPWSGSKWAVTVAATLDDDRKVAIEQDLAKGEWKIVDGSTKRALPDTALITDAGLDGTRLLGLNRHSARATIFTGQADILRVLSDAGHLQEALEKAASTDAADATAEAALNWLKERRSEWVGVAHIGSKPLRAGRAALDAAQEQAETRRDDLAELLGAISNRQKLAAALRKTRDEIELAERLLRWRTVYQLRDRVEKADALSTKLAGASEPDLAVDEDKVRAASEILGAFDSGADVEPPPDGPSAEELQAQIDNLPQLPEGDLEPRPEIQDAKLEMVQAQTALETHMQSAEPELEHSPESTLSADELRTLADVFASTPPEVDTAAVAEFYSSRIERRALFDALQREVDDEVAGYQQAKTDYDAAVANDAQPSELEALHHAERSRAEGLIDLMGRQSSNLLEVLAAQDVQAEVMAQAVAMQQHQDRIEIAREQVLAKSLEPNSEALRALARTIDAAGAAQEYARQHAERAAAFRAMRDGRARALARMLGHDAPPEISEDAVVQCLRTFNDYVDACKKRAEVAQEAARRPDLVAAHTQRQQLESNHRKALAARESQGRSAVDFAAALGINADSVAVAAEELRRWLSEQEAKRKALIERRQDMARLDQLLDGRDLAGLKSELAAATENAGVEPEAAMPPNLDKFRAEAKERHDRAINLDGQLKGQVQTLSNELGSVAEAVEAEADAKRRVTQVETLASCLDAAIVKLTRAKEQANASIAPALANRMRPWLPRVTNGRYLDVTVDPSDLTMQVAEITGQVRRADRLSLGTTEQLYLLLRVTLSQVLSGGTETAPLIFDDVTTQSDTIRTVAVMELLHELSTEHQVIIFSQEDEVLTWAEEHVDPERDKIILLTAP